LHHGHLVHKRLAAIVWVRANDRHAGNLDVVVLLQEMTVQIQLQPVMVASAVVQVPKASLHVAIFVAIFGAELRGTLPIVEVQRASLPSARSIRDVRVMQEALHIRGNAQ